MKISKVILVLFVLLAGHSFITCGYNKCAEKGWFRPGYWCCHENETCYNPVVAGTHLGKKCCDTSKYTLRWKGSNTYNCYDDKGKQQGKGTFGCS